MVDRLRRYAEPLRWVFLIAAAVMLLVFLIAQRQSAHIGYGQAPDTPALSEGSAGELTGASLPSVAQMTALVAANPVVRLPGAIAHWDQQRVAQAIGAHDVRILVAPPGLTKDQRSQLYDVENATIRVIGTRVSGGIYEVTADTVPEWRGQFARGDITGMLVTLISAINKETDSPSTDPNTDSPGADPSADPSTDSPSPGTSDGGQVGGSAGDPTGDHGWREPTSTELADVVTALRSTGVYLAPDATLTGAPRETGQHAFGTDTVLYAAFPVPDWGSPAPAYTPALAKLFPNTPLVVMYGAWVEYAGPHAERFTDLAAATFYGRFGSRLSAYAYPQDNVLGAYLGQVTTIRYAGLFDRPLPYQPFDPLRVALPALPVLFALCVAGFLALSIRSLLRTATNARTHHPGGDRALLAGLTALAVEVSGLTDARTNPALTRAIGLLQAARAALDEELPDRRVRALLDEAQAELDTVGRRLEFAGYRPEAYLRGRLAS